MREIKFRGKTDKNKWVYGSYLRYAIADGGEYHGIMDWKGHHSEINSDTVGEFTGLRDKDGEEIYEGDICLIKFDVNKVEDHIYNSLTVIEKNSGTKNFVVESPLFNNQPELNADFIQVIGNIYDNPEPLENKNDNK